MQIDKPTRAVLTAAVQDRTPSGTLRDLARAIVDWNALIAAAREHRLLPLLFFRLADDASLPLDVRESLSAEYGRNTFHSVANTAELIALQHAFETKKIRMIPVKGLALASAVYRHPAVRAAGDIDLLIFEEDLRPATAVICSRGYELKTDVRADGSPAVPNHYEFHFERKSDGRIVELHWRFQLLESTYGGRFERNLGMEWVWPRRSSVAIGAVDFPNLDPVSNLLMLCMHGAKHRWSRLIWVYDVAQLLEATPDFNWEEALKEAKRKGLLRSLTLGVLLALHFCRVIVPERIVARFESDRTARGLATYFEQAIFESPGQSPPGRVPYTIQILDGQDRLRWLSRMDFLQPNDRDRAFVRLPDPLRPLYFILRLLRLLFDRSPR